MYCISLPLLVNTFLVILAYNYNYGHILHGRINYKNYLEIGTVQHWHKVLGLPNIFVRIKPLIAILNKLIFT